jgi:Domain of unknown function (DUF4388)
MSQRRGTATDRLLNVIQVLQLGKKTGHLLVERGEGRTLEEGEILFSYGQVIQARGGTLQGQEALTWLSTWSTCRFVFVPEPAARTTKPLGIVSPASGNARTQPLQDTQPQPRINSPSTRQEPVGVEQASPALPPGPQRTCSTEEAFRLLDRAGLSRSHRHLFLLVDGHRTLVELVRLTGRPPEEVQRLLHDLANIGVIQ